MRFLSTAVTTGGSANVLLTCPPEKGEGWGLKEGRGP